jgi:UDP-glucuronate 4-epimerase
MISMRVLVTGGAGFIGNALALRLRALGYAPVVIDRVDDYYDPRLKASRLARLPESIPVYYVDCTNLTELQDLFTRYEFDAVCHLAAQAGVRYSLEHPEAYISANYVGTFHILECMKQYNVKNLVFASTSSVYGMDATPPFVETELAPVPVSIYAATKRGSEHLIAAYSHLYQFHATCLRFFTVYGPWGRPDMACHLFTDRILRGLPISVYNHGRMWRDFTYIDDIVEGFVGALTSSEGYRIFNLGAGAPVSLMDFIQTIEHALGLSAHIEYQPLQPGDMISTAANVEAARAAFSYTPRVMIREGIDAYVAWHLSYYKE